MSVIQFFIFVFCSHTPPSAETIPPTGSPRISISAVPSDIRNSAVNTFRWNQQTSETLRDCFTVEEKKKYQKIDE